MVTAILRDSSDRRGVLEALDGHEREVSVTFARALGGYLDDGPHMLVYITGLPADFANGVKSPRLDEGSVDEAVRLVTELLRSVGVPGTWVLTPLSEPAELGDQLERSGIMRSFDLQIMTGTMADMDLATEDPPDLTIRRVEGVEDHRKWLSVMEAGFGMPEGDTRTIDETARAVGFDPAGMWVRFVGTTGDHPVASSGLMLAGGLAGVYNVATVPEARRRGFGAAMTRAAIRHARHRGYRIAMLAASEMGRGTYERMGFADVCVERRYVYDPSAV